MALETQITAVVVTYESAGMIAPCLASLPPAMPVILIDNASSDDTVERVRSIRPDAQIRVMDRNLGFGRAINRGMAEVATPYALIINPDVVLETDVDPLVSALSGNRTLFAVAPMVLSGDGTHEFHPRGVLFSRENRLYRPLLRVGLRSRRAGAPGEIGFLHGCAFAVDVDRFRALGGFDEAIFLYFEDEDLCYRAHRAGLRMATIPSVRCRHGNGRSSSVSAREEFAAFKKWHYEWSRAYVQMKHRPGAAARAEIILWLTVMRLKAMRYRLTGRALAAAKLEAQAAGGLASLRATPANLRLGDLSAHVHLHG